VQEAWLPNATLCLAGGSIACMGFGYCWRDDSSLIQAQVRCTVMLQLQITLLTN
jgi:hypothetical protein